MRNKVIILLAIVFGLMTAFGSYKYFNYLQDTYRVSGNYARVVVATEKIPARVIIQEQMLKSVEMPTEYIPADVVVDAGDVLGKMARSDIYPGEQILHGKLVSKGDPASGLAGKVEPGKRAVTISVNQVSSLAGMLIPGDKVDITVTMEVNETMTSTFIQNVPILAIDTNTEPGTPKAEPPSTITMLVTPTQSQELILASESGSIRMVLRSPEDNQALQLPAIKINALVR